MKGRRLRLAEPLVLALLEDPEELHLDLERNLADLVEEERPLARGFELSRAILVGPGESAASIAEELRLDERRRKRGAVDGDEGHARSVPELVEDPRGELLSGSGLTADEHRRAGGGEETELLVDVVHGGGVADELERALVGLLLAGGDGLRLRVVGGQPQRAVHMLREQVGIERLRDEVERPVAHSGSRSRPCRPRPR